MYGMIMSMKYLLSLLVFSVLTVGFPATSSAQGCIFGLFFCDGGTVETVETDELRQFLEEARVRDGEERAATPRDGSFGSGSNPTVGPSDGLEGYIIATGYFINYSLIPLLIGIALLVFLYNILRYYINSANLEARDKARTSALYGVAAFVAIVSIWGVVNLLVGGFNFDREESLCPDYLGDWCGSQGFGSFTRTPVTNTSSDDNSSGSGSSGNAATSGSGSNNNNQSPLAELLFGQFQDEADFGFRSGPPRAQTNTVVIASDATCIAGFTALQLSANVESSQAAFALYENSAGATVWQNITDETSATEIVYDADTVNDINGSGNTNVHIVHTHPRSRTAAAGLSMDGHGPSTADHDQICDTTAPDATYITVDQNNLWQTTQPTDACPRSTSADDDLVIIDALSAVAMVNASDREYEWERMLDSSLTPSRHQGDLAQFGTLALNGLSVNQILDRALPFMERANLTVQRTSIASVCSSF